MDNLFGDLPSFPVALPDDELRLLSQMPDWPSNMEIDRDQYAACRRLEKRGLIKIERQKMDPVAIDPDWFAGKLPTSSVREVGKP